MCGIFACEVNENLENLEQLELAFNKGKSRGPESSKTIIIDNLYLGFHRLAINGLDSLSDQPMCIDGIYLICNGEIYNYRSFKKIKMNSKSDCEVIIHLYKLYGIEYLLELLDGVFAFVLYDSNIKKVFVARDPYGVRPLFFSGTSFASELKQLSGENVKNVFNVKQFEPGSFMEIQFGKVIRQQRFSSFGFSKMIFNNLYDIYGILYQTLYNAVKKRVNSTERPIACLLSGGLDSSVITALVNSFLPKGKLETYSIGLEGSTDLVYAQKVADHLGTKHTSIVLTEDQFFDSIPEVINAIESYDTTTVRASVGNYLVGKYIKGCSDAKVIFNGDGADELMGGYRYFNYVPDEIEFDRECKRLLSNIHFFDVLRSDRCISTHGLEPRTPFLDRSFVQVYLSLPADLRNHVYNNQPEKFLLRGCIAFMNKDLLPEEVLMRQKEAFSDGVSSLERSWYKIIEEKVPEQVPEQDQVKIITNEQFYYRGLFDGFFPNCGEIIPYMWMPKYVKTNDPSARTI